MATLRPGKTDNRSNFSLITRYSLELGGKDGARRGESYVEGEKEGRSFLLELARSAANQAQGRYAELGFSIGVEARQAGNFFILAVVGPDRDQKMARVLEGGSRGFDLFDFLRMAKGRRRVKIAKKRKGARGDTYQGEGYYLVIPKVLGRVVKSNNGGFRFEPVVNRNNPNINRFTVRGGDATALMQNTTALAGSKAELNDDVDGNDDYYRDGSSALPGLKRRGIDTGDGLGYTDFERDSSGHTVTGPGPLTQSGNNLWERLQFTRKSGRALAGQGPRRGLERPEEGKTSVMDVLARINRQTGANLGNVTVRNLDLGSSLPAGFAGTPMGQLAQSRAGQVVGFMTLSTRMPNRHVPGRKAEHVLEGALRGMRDELRRFIQDSEAQMTQKQRTLARTRGQYDTLRRAL